MNVLEIPGVIEAIEHERLIRDAAFLPVLEHINGYPAVPMTLIQYNMLRIGISPLIPPFRVTSAVELAEFLWLLNPEYSLDTKQRAKFLKSCRSFLIPPMPWFRTRTAMRRWGEHFAKSIVRFSQTLIAARNYMDETLMDRPGTMSGSGYLPSFYSDICDTITGLAREYGGGIESYRNLPIKVVFQLLNEMKDWNTPRGELILFNPLSERAMNRYIARN